jgi:hypothetical protein
MTALEPGWHGNGRMPQEMTEFLVLDFFPILCDMVSHDVPAAA